MIKAEPRFDLDLQYGKDGERQIAEFLDWIISENGRVEVKRKRILDHKIYVETHCDRGNTGTFTPSGIQVTTAQIWAFVIGDTGIHVAIPTDILRDVLDDPSSRDRSELDGSCPTRGKLVDFCVLLYRLRRRREKAIADPPVEEVEPMVDLPGALSAEALRELGRAIFRK